MPTLLPLRVWSGRSGRERDAPSKVLPLIDRQLITLPHQRYEPRGRAGNLGGSSLDRPGYGCQQRLDPGSCRIWREASADRLGPDVVERHGVNRGLAVDVHAGPRVNLGIVGRGWSEPYRALPGMQDRQVLRVRAGVPDQDVQEPDIQQAHQVLVARAALPQQSRPSAANSPKVSSKSIRRS